MITDEFYRARKSLIESFPLAQRQPLLSQLDTEKLQSEIDDADWERWYEYYHQVVLNPDSVDFVVHIRTGLQLNLQATAVCAAIGALVVPSMRVWWVFVLTAGWLFLLIAEIITAYSNANQKWSTLRAQIKYLASTPPLF